MGHGAENGTRPKGNVVVRRKSSYEVVYTTSKGVANHLFTFRYIYFHALPLLLSLAVSIEVWYLASEREVKEADESFDHICEDIVLSVNLAWKLTVMQPDFLVALYFSTSIPGRDEFQRFTTSNPYWNLAGTIAEVEWVPLVTDADRPAFQNAARETLPGFRIWQFGDNGPTEVQNHTYDIYCPIFYDPTDSFIVGLDLCNDPIEGPIIQGIRQTGIIASAPPFELRGLPADTEFKMGTTLYMPLFNNASDGALTTVKMSQYVGCVVTVIHYQPLLKNILQDMDLLNLDVFLFEVDAVRGPYYLAHYESGLNDTMPHIPWTVAQYLKPDNITGDLTSSFDTTFDVPALDRTYRLFVRARSGHYINNYRTILPVILLLISLTVKFFDKFMIFIEKRIYRAGHHHDAHGSAAAAGDHNHLDKVYPGPISVHAEDAENGGGSSSAEGATKKDPLSEEDKALTVARLTDQARTIKFEMDEKRMQLHDVVRMASEIGADLSHLM